MKTVTFFLCLITMSVKISFAQVFTDINAGIPGIINGASLDWGDYDNDGDADLIVTGQLDTVDFPRICRIYKNDSGIFNRVDVNINPYSFFSFVKWIDWDFDGDLDILHSRADWTVLIENDNGSFIEHNLNINNSGFICVGDYDNDGDQDFINTGGSYTYSQIYRNDSCLFTPIASTIFPLKFGSADFGDYDNDGDKDLVISGETNSIADYKLFVYRNDSNDIFTPINISFDSIRGNVTWGDYDNDGDLDILVSGVINYNQPFTAIYENIGNDQFVESGVTLPQISGESSFFDYDKDNDLDILVAGNKGIYPNTVTVIRVLRNDGSGSFFEINPLIYTQYGDFSIADYNNDGYPDFAISGPNQLNGTDYSTRIYLNNFATSYTASSIQADFSVYPNPTSDIINFQVSPLFGQIKTVSIYDLFGHQILEKSDNFNSINVKSLSSGIYIIVLKNFDEKMLIHKLIKE